MTVPFAPGMVLVDKPAGKTSFAMVRLVRRLSGVKKVGHAGTLDPFATGLLVVCIGRPATRLIDRIMAGEKQYLATLVLGTVSSTQDPEGQLIRSEPWPPIEHQTIEQVLDRFRGPIMQSPPAFSAVKHQGKPLYHYARNGIIIEKPPRPVTISLLRWLDPREQVTMSAPTLELLVECSKGTYIRTLAADIGAALGCGAYLTALRRLASGSFSVEQSVCGQALAAENGPELLRQAFVDVDEVQKCLQSSGKSDNITCYG
ncbi:tRNA pseudouridine(55) synthase TruB [Desulfofustis glycolicus]|uniref:tRNA pseudouridine synthase B n=1 Tax=Desulfofustis glycolicus DSM 9705 TaxID=1121409 RepID=A0A1M5T117_9BACT|nr:tRNA pseudouridine(55) synthase TruB [Desulfofustis glycolicus]MCB2215307.1 tRNA pseudouridine(55) synthase TruB [Desulfobulbaceae bacterium]SHH44514.1 tRNA pseudouridine synthase B [Desulfofustis glycolicus DSM 9705]